MASGYIASVMTPLFCVTNSTISLSAARLTSFHFKSLRGSCMKSNNTQHCRNFCINNSSLSAGVASGKRNNRHFVQHGLFTAWSLVVHNCDIMLLWGLLPPCSTKILMATMVHTSQLSFSL